MAGSFRFLILATAIVCALARCRILFICMSPSRVVAALLDVMPRRPHRRADAIGLIALTDGIARRMPWKPTCLERALVSARLLAAANVAGRVVVGVTTHGRELFDAHAWIEVAGLPAPSGPHQPLTGWAFPTNSPQ